MPNEIVVMGHDFRHRLSVGDKTARDDAAEIRNIVGQSTNVICWQLVRCRKCHGAANAVAERPGNRHVAADGRFWPSGTAGDRRTMAVFLAKFRFRFSKASDARYRKSALWKAKFRVGIRSRNQVRPSREQCRRRSRMVTPPLSRGSRGGRAMRLLLVLKEIYCGDLNDEVKWSGCSMADYVVEFGKDGRPVEPDGRLDAQAFHRNHLADLGCPEPIPGRPVRRRAGSRQRHRPARGLFCAPDPRYHLVAERSQSAASNSITAWRRHAGAPNIRDPRRIDLSEAQWWRRTAAVPAPCARLSAPTSSISRRGVWPRACLPAQRAICAMMDGCFSMGLSNATANTPHRAMLPSTKA